METVETVDNDNDDAVVAGGGETAPVLATPAVATPSTLAASFLSPPIICGRVGIDTPDDIFLGRHHVASSDVESPASTSEKKKDDRKKNCNPSQKIDLDNVPEINIILPLRSLVTMIKKQFNCSNRVCKSNSANMEFEVETFGIANSLHVRCDCGRQSSATATLTESARQKITTRVDGGSFANRVNAASFDINTKILLATQLSGGGRQELKNIAGMLNLGNNPMSKQITKLREDIGLKILEVAEEVLLENLEIEKERSPEDDDGNSLLSVSNDARWDKRGSNRTYDSSTGCSVMMGARSSLVVGLECLSTRCAKCTLNQEHESELCSKNYDGHAKGMESTGALALVKRVTEEGNECFVRNYISDDDSSSRAILTHNFKELIAAKLMKKEDVPRGNCLIKGKGNGAYKWNKGKLPLSHPPINALGDKNHRLRHTVSPLFAFARGPKEKSLGITGLDAERYKRRGGWTLRLRGGDSYEDFRRHVLAWLEHHFDNHEFCGDWCKAKGAEGQEKVEHSFRFRNKTDNKDMYLAFKKIHDAFMEEDSLRQLHHIWDTNCVEGFNKLITKFLPKDRNFGTTIENKVRIHLAMCLLSIGYKRFFKRLFKKLGLARGDYCRRFLRAEDKDRQWRKHYRRRPSVKKARMKNLYKKLKEGREKQVRDAKRGLEYCSGMMSPVGKDDQANKKAKKAAGVCGHCGLDTHSRISSKLCPKNPKNAMLTVEKEDGIGEDGESDDSMSSIDDDENLDFESQELADIEAMEALPLEDIFGDKYCKVDNSDYI